MKLWCFRVAALVLVPLVLFGALELSLHVAGYGYPTGFFKSIRIRDADCLVENDKFGLRFFPPAQARSPAPVVMKAKKEAGAYRIFILGESAALGDPRPAYGPGRYLQTVLRERFPGVEFEVISVAMTAINSHAILPIARECAQHEGDLWIIYMGNNEMVGPFGAATVFGAQAPPRLFVRLALGAQRMRLGQLASELIQKWKNRSSKAGTWGGMQMFMNNRVAPDDMRKQTVYKNYEQNLKDILRTGLRAGANVLLSTVAVNLKDCPPFASVVNTNLPPKERGNYERLYAEAEAAENQGSFADAAMRYEEAAKLESHVAELQYRWGSCLVNEGKGAEARQRLQQACDDDALPFRTDSTMNASIREAAAANQNEHLKLFDAVALFATNSPLTVPGSKWFYEHVHFNFDGNYVLARAWAEQIEEFLPQTMRNRAAGTWATQETCEQRLGLTDWNRAAVFEDMIQRLRQPPFTGQLNNTQTIASLRVALATIQKRLDTNAAAGATEVYERAIAQAPDDHRLHENYAEFLEARGALPRAVAEWQQVAELIPHHHIGYFQVGRLLVLQGKLAEAEPPLFTAVKLRPDLSEGWFQLGTVHALEDKSEIALEEFERARRLIPEDYRVYYHSGKLLSKLGRRAEAIQRFREAVRLRPGYWQASYALGEELAFEGQTKEAIAQFQEVLRVRPNYDLGHLNLGVALFKAGQVEAARREFAETLRLNPKEQRAADYLRQLERF